MVSKRMDFGGSRDAVSGLTEDLICHILSFLTTKEAASTSALAKKWRYLFASDPNLDLDDSVYLNPTKKTEISKSFMDFVDRVLALQGNALIHKFSLKIKYDVDPVHIISWIHNVLERGVSDLVLCMGWEWESQPVPSKIFVSETLVTLKLKFEDDPTIDVEDVFLPKLKTLYIRSVYFEKEGLGLAKLLSGCRMLEELTLKDICWYPCEFASVCVTTLKRLKYRWTEHDDNPKSMSFDTPNLVYLDYSENIADKYPRVNFGSLVEASIDLRMTKDQKTKAQSKEGEENDLVDNATTFMKGICNVKILHLSANTLEILNYYCEAIPLFNNLTHLTIESGDRVGWESLPSLLKNAPNLETLVLSELLHEKPGRCGCTCLWGKGEIHTCLSSSPVKVLKVLDFGYINELGEQIDQVKHFIETMPNLEQLILYYDVDDAESAIGVFEEVQIRVTRVASSKCNLKLISDTICMSCHF